MAADPLPNPPPQAGEGRHRKPYVTAAVVFAKDVNGTPEHPAIVTYAYVDGVTGEPTGFVDLAVIYRGGGAPIAIERVPFDPPGTPQRRDTWRWPAKG